MRFSRSLIVVLAALTTTLLAEEKGAVRIGPIRVGVLSASENPGPNTSQGLYISILREAGIEAGPVLAEAVKAGALEKLDVFIIGGGSGTAFNKSLGPDGGEKIEAFVKAGGRRDGELCGRLLIRARSQ
jgi:hypothetical protein